MTTESDIMFDDNAFAWVLRDKPGRCYAVMLYNFTHSVTDCAFPLTDDGLSLAVARAKYLAEREHAKALRA